MFWALLWLGQCRQWAHFWTNLWGHLLVDRFFWTSASPTRDGLIQLKQMASPQWRVWSGSFWGANQNIINLHMGVLQHYHLIFAIHLSLVELQSSSRFTGHWLPTCLSSVRQNIQKKEVRGSRFIIYREASEGLKKRLRFKANQWLKDQELMLIYACPTCSKAEKCQKAAHPEF